jgi:uncharacterized Zn-binding protein involved in type VI secretion
MFPAARKGDTTGHGGVIVTGSPSVTINGVPAALTGISSATCKLHPCVQAVVVGSASVFINNVPAAHIGGTTSCGAPITTGSPDVLIGS